MHTKGQIKCLRIKQHRLIEVKPVNVLKKDCIYHQLPSQYKKGKSPSGEITTGPSGKAFPSCTYENNEDKHKTCTFLISMFQPQIKN